MRYAGQTVSILLVDGERDDLGLRDKLDEIRETMGLEVEVSTLALGALLESNNQNLRADQSAYDIAHILGFSVAGTVGAGLLTPLNDYVGDPSRTPEGYDLPDFPAGQLEYCGYFDVEAGQFGGDDLFLIPGIHSGSVIMYYRPDLYEEAGLCRADDLGGLPGQRRGAEPGRRVRDVDDRRQRRVAVPRRLVLAVHHDGRPADERNAGDPGLRAQPDQRAVGARPPAHDRLRRASRPAASRRTGSPSRSTPSPSATSGR